MSRDRNPDGETARVQAPAKVNLSLRVLAREDGGYHQLETLFCALELADEIEITTGGDGIRLEVEGAELGPVEDNLVHRAARAFFEAAHIPGRIGIRLRKEIPAGAGLGGGSSDAAAALHALNELHGRPLSESGLLDLAAGLGSDVPFFLCGSPLALAWGRGERLMPLPPLPKAPILVAVPDFAIPTPSAYRDLDAFRAAAPESRPGSQIFRPESLRDWGAVAAAAINDFEAPTFARFPALARIRALLIEAGASFALLSGSGSAIFGVFSDVMQRSDAALALRGHSPTLRLIETYTAG